MSHHIERRAPAAPGERSASGNMQTLVDIMYEGFYALFLLKNGCGPQDITVFAEHMTQFLGDVDRKAKQAQIPPEDIDAAKYAFCAAIDEIILRSQFDIRKAWETRPLQLRLFGDQLAGEHFFERLDQLRARGGAQLQTLEVFHMCLLLGFQGRYALNEVDKLNYLSARLGDEISRMRGKNRGFAPDAERPDQIANKLRSDLSLWVLTAVFSLAGLCAFIGFRASLDRHTEGAMARYSDLVKLPPRTANVTITLP